MFEIVVEGEFSAAHFLKLYDGSWEPRHGHNWKVAVTAQADRLDSMGVVMDFEMLKPALRDVLAQLQYTSINEHPRFKDQRLNPSTENIARVICEELAHRVKSPSARVTKVTVWETPDACASYAPPDLRNAKI